MKADGAAAALAVYQMGQSGRLKTDCTFTVRDRNVYNSDGRSRRAASRVKGNGWNHGRTPLNTMGGGPWQTLGWVRIFPLHTFEISSMPQKNVLR